LGLIEAGAVAPSSNGIPFDDGAESQLDPLRRHVILDALSLAYVLEKPLT
jgi:hypothetical protein